ncbi:MAG TPA: hypothetical protein VM012_08260 [Flavitalea sp.]|nr:hypothetical protein [Flavitalea sp.]
MINIKWNGLDSPDESITPSFRQKLILFINDKVKDLQADMGNENGFFDVTDADNPAQLSIVPKNFSPELTKRILRKFSEIN